MSAALVQEHWKQAVGFELVTLAFLRFPVRTCLCVDRR
jgi:hypothetical protein